MAPSPRSFPLPPPRAATLILHLLLLLSFSAAARYPSPAPPPAPAPLGVPPRQVASANDPTPSPPSPRHPRHHRHRHRPHRPPPPPPPRRRLNFGERLGIAFAGVAVAMQVVLGAFLALRAWQLRRLDKAEVSSSTPLT